jgi:hydrogenase maturation protease
LVACIGNSDRGDDAAGRLVARLLAARVPQRVKIAELSGEATALIEALRTSRQAWVIDAALSGSPSGTIHRIDCSAADTPVPRSPASSHGFGVAEAIALARTLDMLPPRCIVYAIEGAEFVHGTPPSPAVMRAVHEVADRVLAELSIRPRPSSRLPPRQAPETDRR